MFDLPPLPYPMNALEPYISEKTMEFHYGKHHKAYVDNLNKLVKDTEFENMPLEEVVKNTAGRKEFTGIFNNAAQAWNHAFFWNCMQKNGGGEPSGELKKKIERDFGSYENFRSEFKTAATTQFGSGMAGRKRRQAERHENRQCRYADCSRLQAADYRRRLGACLLS